MLRKWKKPGKKILSVFGILAVLVAGCIGFTGCHGDEEENAKVQDLEFTVIGENEILWQNSSGKKGRSPSNLHTRTDRICTLLSEKALRQAADTV